MGSLPSNMQREAPQARFIHMTPIVLAVANQKGGVGKTTSAVNIAAAIAHLGHSTLLIDSDPQGNATSGLGVAKKNLRHSLYTVLTGESSAIDAVRETKFKNLSVLPTTIDLAGAEFDLMERPQRHRALADAIDSLGGAYSFVIIDCPPSLGLLTVNALSAASGVIIPMTCEYFALEGLSQLMMSIKRVKNTFNPTLSVAGILVTMYDGRLNLSAQVLDELKKYYSDALLHTMIPRNVRLSEAPSYGEPILYYDKYSRGSLAYQDVAKELLSRLL